MAVFFRAHDPPKQHGGTQQIAHQQSSKVVCLATSSAVRAGVVDTAAAALSSSGAGAGAGARGAGAGAAAARSNQAGSACRARRM